jgi:hypothetical protein
MSGKRWEVLLVLSIVGLVVLEISTALCWLVIHSRLDGKELIPILTFGLGLLVPSPLAKTPAPDEPVPVTNAPGDSLDVTPSPERQGA